MSIYTWVFIGRSVAEAWTTILRPPDVKSQFIGKDPVAGKDWKQKEKGVTEDERVGGITSSVDTNLSELQETDKDRGAWWATVRDMQSDTT